MNIYHILIVASGGALGAVSRFLFVTGMKSIEINHQLPFAVVPSATIIVNIVGSFLLGIVVAILFSKGFAFSGARQLLFLFLAVGFFGSFTTFSTFALDVFILFDSNRIGILITYALSSVVFSVIALIIGYKFTDMLIKL